MKTIKETTREREIKEAKRIIKFPVFAMLILVFFSSLGFRDKLIQGWYQQWLPDLNGSTIKDITFLDSLTGFAVTNTNSSYLGYLLKTTNGGNDWNIKLTYNPPYTNVSLIKLHFVNSNTGYACTDYIHLFKTTNRGDNWTTINTYLYPEDVAVINIDTIIAVKSNGLNGGVYRTTDGGNNWQLIWTNGTSGNPDRIYMVNKNLGFHCDFSSSFYTRRTTNGGLNWVNINEDSFAGIGFYDTLIGWKGDINGIKKTTNGGLNWIIQTTPQMSYFNCFDISVINKDTVWFVGCRKTGIRAVICKTTNGGTNWGYQMLDTSINFYNFYHLCFTNKNNGWAYFVNNTGVHTNTGGNDTTFYTAVNNQTTLVPEKYILFQNYPNPFNQITIIKYQLSIRANVSINIYDITGKEIDVLINKMQSPGVYDLRYDAGNLSSGVYFYSLYADGKRMDTKRMVLVK